MAVCELADLYVNPTRKGGGTSAIYAMTAGKPIVTLKYGDVYKNCGEEFAVEDLANMNKLIRRYMVDFDYYNKMSERARNMADLYSSLDQTVLEMIDCLE